MEGLALLSLCADLTPQVCRARQHRPLPDSPAELFPLTLVSDGGGSEAALPGSFPTTHHSEGSSSRVPASHVLRARWSPAVLPEGALPLPRPSPLLDISRAPVRTAVLTLVTNGVPGELGNGSCLSPTWEVLGLMDLSELPVIPVWCWLAVRGGLWEVGEPWAGGRECPLKMVKCRVS